METTDLTIEILKAIRAELQTTNGRLESMGKDLAGRIDQTNERLGELREELSRRIVESEVRTATALTEVAGTVREMTSVLRAQGDLRPRVEQCEQDIAELRRRPPAA